MSKKTTISDADKALFRDTVAKKAPEDKDSRVEGTSEDTSSRPRLTQRTIEASSSLAVGPEDKLYYATSGLQQKNLKKLKHGGLPLEARLDLHNLTIEEAALSLQHFLNQCLHEGRRVVLIVHGKGHRSGSSLPILKNQVNLWLREWPEVLAFSSCLPKDGGTGALYVMLKRNNP